MKKAFTLMFFVLVIVSISTTNAQTKKDLIQRLETLEKANFGALTDINTLKGDVIELQNQLSKIKIENESLKQQIASINKNAVSQPSNAISTVKQEGTTSAPGRCKAITSSGIQCSRNADPGSEYCWQHKKTYEPNSTPAKSNIVSPSENSGSSGGNTGSGRTIQTGPRGGKYYINSHGNKTYIKR